jgi:hypothetical protein
LKFSSLESRKIKIHYLALTLELLLCYDYGELNVFFSIFSHCFKSCDWPKEDLSKSDYKTNKEVENLGILLNIGKPLKPTT